ncbi:hypothetical protein TIFTF001_018070 [Ficus carica]|uniref:Uncharacterized protein n=1 Tax=Ficus carica TaxID=3494 RepID=A0AA88DJ56_FICCA|nr:hypothetical protein TIFTF001_018070 [Ficus carica]
MVQSVAILLVQQLRKALKRPKKDTLQYFASSRLCADHAILSWTCPHGNTHRSKTKLAVASTKPGAHLIPLRTPGLKAFDFVLGLFLSLHAFPRGAEEMDVKILVSVSC